MTPKQGDTVYIKATVDDIDKDECSVLFDNGRRGMWIPYSQLLPSLPAPETLTPEQVELYRGAIALAAADLEDGRPATMIHSDRYSYYVSEARSILEAVKGQAQ